MKEPTLWNSRLGHVPFSQVPTYVLMRYGELPKIPSEHRDPDFTDEPFMEMYRDILLRERAG